MVTDISIKEANALIKSYLSPEVIKEVVDLLVAKVKYDGDVKAAIYLLDRVGGKPIQGVYDATPQRKQILVTSLLGSLPSSPNSTPAEAAGGREPDFKLNESSRTELLSEPYEALATEAVRGRRACAGC